MHVSGPRPAVSSLSVSRTGELLVVDDVGRSRPLRRHPEPVGKPVDRDDPLGAEHPGAGDGELSDGSTSPHGHHVARLDVAHLRTHVAGRQDVRQEQHLLVRHALGHLHRSDVRERHAGILRLAAGVAAEHVRVPEQPGGRMPHQLLRHPRIRIGVLAEREQVSPAHGTGAAGDRKGNDHPIARLEVLDRAPGLDHLAHEFVAQDVALLHRGDEPVEQVQVRAADRGGGDPDDGVARVEDLGIRDLTDLDVSLAHPADGFHERTP